MSLNGTGAGQLAHDSKWGNIVNSVAATLATAGIEILANVDWSAWPAWVGVLGVPAAGLVSGLLTSKVLPRFKK